MDSMQVKKRFYKDVTTDTGDDGWVIKLDNRMLRSPAGALLHLPSQALAAAVADEWRAQDEHIDAASMPLFSLAVTVLDRVIPQQPAILRELASYGDNDLLCYRADDDDLAAHQQQFWQPWLEWADSAFGVSLEVATGIMPVNQPHAGGFHDALQQFDAWRLGALHRAVSLGGSLILGLGFVAGRLDAEQLFNTAFLDELWQNEKWGRDYEAEDRQNYICAELAEAARFLQLLPDQPQAST
jgi:chaperone required for assembly of F1-ATPase